MPRRSPRSEVARVWASTPETAVAAGAAMALDWVPVTAAAVPAASPGPAAAPPTVAAADRLRRCRRTDCRPGCPTRWAPGRRCRPAPSLAPRMTRAVAAPAGFCRPPRAAAAAAGRRPAPAAGAHQPLPAAGDRQSARAAAGALGPARAAVHWAVSARRPAGRAADRLRTPADSAEIPPPPPVSPTRSARAQTTHYSALLARLAAASAR